MSKKGILIMNKEILKTETLELLKRVWYNSSPDAYDTVVNFIFKTYENDNYKSLIIKGPQMSGKTVLGKFLREVCKNGYDIYCTDEATKRNAHKYIDSKYKIIEIDAKLLIYCPFNDEIFCEPYHAKALISDLFEENIYAEIKALASKFKEYYK